MHAQIVDERLWGDEDRKDKPDRPEDKYDKDAPLQVWIDKYGSDHGAFREQHLIPWILSLCALLCPHVGPGTSSVHLMPPALD